MLCSISGETPKHPVVSTKSGHVFEKSLIEKYISEHHSCPITGDSLTTDDLLPLKSSEIPTPRTPTATSIPSLLTLFQNEWDSIVLEVFTLKKQYQEALQELSHALYQHDAACRVIARLMKERDNAREALQSLKGQLANGQEQTTGGEDGNMEVDEYKNGNNPLSAEILEKLQNKSTILSQERKKLKVKANEESNKKLAELSVKDKIEEVIGSSEYAVGCVCGSNNDVIGLSAGKNIVLYERTEGKAIATFKSHTKLVNALSWSQYEDKSLLLSASSDKTVRGWRQSEEGKWSNFFVLKHHSAEVVDVVAHPVSEFFVSFSADGSWSFNDISSNSSLLSVTSENEEVYTCGAVHPDGLLVATGAENGEVKIWDLRTQSIAFECPEKHEGGVQSMSFSENGYYFATAGSKDSTVKIWDLRKLAKVKEIELPEGYVVRKVKFDLNGTYLAVCGSDIRFFVSKQWDEISILEEAGGKIYNDISFAKDYIAATSQDGVVDIFQ